jgi:tRNA threonylcarbamoyladenosine biosynthesis protein TsaB
MITLAIDTCDRNGSVGVRINENLSAVRRHEGEDYSSWLLPAVESSLSETGKNYRDLNLLAVATGPGSFTGVRVGLCAVKAWAEAYGKPVVGVSRLAAMARQIKREGWVAAVYDAHRGQIFGGLYRHISESWNLVEEEMVNSPTGFLDFVNQQVNGSAVSWVSLQPELICDLAGWGAHESGGSSMAASDAALVNLIGELAEGKATNGEFTDVLSLDANYVRRSDAEIYWKGPAHRGG